MEYQSEILISRLDLTTIIFREIESLITQITFFPPIVSIIDKDERERENFNTLLWKVQTTAITLES